MAMTESITDKQKRERMDKAIKYLRMFLQDTEELNRLLFQKELDDEHLRFAIDMAISDWNSTMPPIPQRNIMNFPSLYLLMHGGAIQALKMAGMRQSRNEISYNSGGSSFMRSNHTQHYQSWIGLFTNDYEMKKRNMKIATNVSRGYGEVFSEYDYIGFW
jgi:hypothetical protein